jgi:alpha-galactosidase
VKFSLFQHFGILAAAGDRHLVEFLPGFIQSPETLFQWGIIRTPVSWRIERWKNAPQKTRDLMSERAPLELKSSGEEGIGQIKALVGLGNMVTNVNLQNQGQIANLPLDVVVETNAHLSCDEARPLSAGSLPAGLAPLIARHCANQELIIESALTQDKHLAFQAFFSDPSNPLPIDRAWELFNQMLQTSCDYLPGWNFE